MHPLLMMLAAALPQTAAPAAGDVVVTARSQSAAEEAKRLTRSISPAINGQLARMDKSVCVQVVGLPAPYDRFVANRIEAVAREAGIPVAKQGCTPNILAAFVSDGGALLRQLERQGSSLLGALDPGERRRLMADKGPVRVASLTEIKSRDGDQLQSVGPGGLSLAGGAPTLEVRSASVVNPPTRVDINAALVLIDKPAILGKKLGQVSDHIALRALAVTRSSRIAAGDDTILSLFTPGATPPPGLTGFDRTYLRTLYHGPPTRSALSKVTEIGQAAAKGAR